MPCPYIQTQTLMHNAHAMGEAAIRELFAVRKDFVF